uniref:TMP-TENI domain-containing protein n=1 Tax=Steinernema glaseri TaxID=37863 RepID=A0A1I8AQ95_9BILA
MGNAHVTGLALGLEFTGVGQLALPVAQVVHLQQIDLVGAQAAQRLGPLRLRRSLAVGGDLGGQEGALAPTALLQQLAQYRVGAAIVGRGIDDPAATVEEHLQHRFELL